MTDADEFESFGYGDRVRLVQNHLLTGQVIGEKNWGSEYLVRLGATVTTIWFEHVELEIDPEFEPPITDAVDGSGSAGAKPDNVINLADVRVAGRG